MLEIGRAAIGVDRLTYTRWETGERHPSVGAMAKLAAFFNTSIEALLSIPKAHPQSVRSRSRGGGRDVDAENQRLTGFAAIHTPAMVRVFRMSCTGFRSSTTKSAHAPALSTPTESSFMARVASIVAARRI